MYDYEKFLSYRLFLCLAYSPWSSDSYAKMHLQVEQLLLDKFLTEDSLILSIHESEVSFG